jgi:hypothetical protein
MTGRSHPKHSQERGPEAVAMGNAAGHTHGLHSSTNTSFVNRGRPSLPTFQGAGRGNINAGRAIIFRSGSVLRFE